MTAFTIRLPAEKHERLKSFAQMRGLSLNRLMEEMATQVLIEHDIETRFRARQASGQGRQAEGLALLDKAL